MITLFDDQQRLLDKARGAIGAGRRAVLLQAATGAGKTVIASAIIHGSRNKGTRSMMLVPRRQLLKQTVLTFEEYKIPHSFCADGYAMNQYAQTFLGTIGTVLSRIRSGKPIPEVKLLIVDETHYGGKGLDEIIAFYRARGAVVLGLSATPERLDGKGLGCWYEEMVMGESIGWLIENRRLSDYRLFSVSQPDLSGIKRVNGDYARGELSERMMANRKNIGDAVKYYRQHAMGRLNVTYTTSREHNELVCAMFNEQGIPSAVVDGTTPDAEMRRIIRAYANRELLNLVNCELLTFGFDLGAASGMDVTIESMTDLRPTESLALQMQKWGRVLRRKDTPAMIFDHAGNAMRPNGLPKHGLPDDERQWSLAGAGESSGNGERASPVKQCDSCFFTHRPAPQCPNCGKVYEVSGRMVEHVDGELVEVTRKPRVLTPEQAKVMQEAVEKMEKAAIARGVPKHAARNWAKSKIMAQFGG